MCKWFEDSQKYTSQEVKKNQGNDFILLLTQMEKKMKANSKFIKKKTNKACMDVWRNVMFN